MPVAVESWFLKTAELGRAEDVHLLARTWGCAVVSSEALSSCPESVVSILGEGRWAVLGEGRT